MSLPLLKKEYFKNNSRGFTMVELIVIMAIIGGLATVFIARYPATQQRARDTQRETDLAQYRNALQLHYNAKGVYPDSAVEANLAAICQSELLSEQFASECPDDPLDGKNYKYKSLNGAQDFYVYAELEQETDDSEDTTPYYVSTSYGLSGILEEADPPGSGDEPPLKTTVDPTTGPTSPPVQATNTPTPDIVDEPSCSEIGQSCSIGSDCCSEFCNSEGLCALQKTSCAGEGDICGLDSPCCSGLSCSSGVCLTAY